MTEADVLAPLRAALAASAELPGDAPVRQHNRLMTAINKECESLAQDASGRRALLAALTEDPDARLRLTAATTVQRWDVPSARACLEALVREGGGTVVRPMTMTAALAVPGGPSGVSGAAALCLLNLDNPRRPSPREAAHVAAAVPSKLLDAAERVYGLAMNGGIDHAYELAGDEFDAAARALDAVGATDAASALRGVLALVARAPRTRKGRESALAGLTTDQGAQVQLLGDAFCAADDIMERLEAASEAD